MGVEREGVAGWVFGLATSLVDGWAADLTADLSADRAFGVAAGLTVAASAFALQRA